MTVEWTRFETAMGFVPGLSASALWECRYAETIEAARRVAQAASELEDAARATSLFEVVPTIREPGLRRKVLAARRAVFKSEPLPAGDWIERLGCEHPETVLRLARYSAATEQIERLESEAAQAFERDRQRSERRLEALLTDPTFELGLDLANPPLAARRRVERGRRGAKGRRRDRVSELRYLFRAALKPVACGYLASVALASPGARPAGATGPVSRTSRVEPNRQLLRLLCDRAVDDAGLLGVLRVRRAAASYEWDGRTWAASGKGAAAAYHPIEIGRRLRAALEAAGSCGCPAATFIEAAGIERSTLVELCDRGVVELCSPLTDAQDEDCLELLGRMIEAERCASPQAGAWIDLFSALEEGILAIERERGSERTASIAALEELFSPEPEHKGRVRRVPFAFEDTACVEAVGLDADILERSLDELVELGVGVAAPRLDGEDRVFVELFLRFFGPDAKVPVLELHRRFLDFCRSHRLDPRPSVSRTALAVRLGLGPDPRLAALQADLERALRDARGRRVRWRPRLHGSWSRADTARISLTFALDSTGEETLLHPILWERDGLSLFPRFARVVERLRPGATDEYVRWMARFPEHVDVYGAFDRNPDVRPLVTRRALRVPASSVVARSCEIRDASVAWDPKADALDLRHPDAPEGTPLRPVFLGLRVRPALDPLAQLVLELGARPPSLFELMIRAMNLAVQRRVRECGREVVRLPAVVVGESILLSRETHVVPAESAPYPADFPSGRLRPPDFLRFLVWCRRVGLPELAAVQYEDREIPLHLGLPEGAYSFFKILHDGRVCVVRPAASAGALGAAGDGAYETHFHVDLAAGSAARAGPAS